MKTFPVLLAVALSAVSCGRTTEPVSHGSELRVVEAGDTLTLQYGDSALLGRSGPSITFSAIEADSRCPVDVTCVWAGDAHVRLDGSRGAGREPLELHTGIEPTEAEFAGYRIRLLDVSPPRREGDDVRPADYSVRLAISRG
ncbi:MAG TPA: hypothetical protein VK912_04360 [Longimicrobiales bacterium]|nr:hypothetical protein [Longimicrobiales bacterium]